MKPSLSSYFEDSLTIARVSPTGMSRPDQVGKVYRRRRGYLGSEKAIALAGMGRQGNNILSDKSRQIEATNRHKSEFLANMSHEL